jgi:hypothetical protein
LAVVFVVYKRGIDATGPAPKTSLLRAMYFLFSAEALVVPEPLMPKKVLVGTERAPAQDFRPDLLAASPRCLEGRYVMEGGDGRIEAGVNVSPAMEGPHEWTVTIELEERVAGRRAVRRFFENDALCLVDGFWVFAEGGSHGVFASYHDSTAREQPAEPGLILDGVFLFLSQP